MMRLRTYLLAAAAALFCALPARAQSYCDNQATGLMLPMPNYNMTFAQWSTCSRNSLLVVNASSAALRGSTVAASLFGPIYTPEIGGRATGTFGIKVSSPLYTLSGGPYLLFRTTVSFDAQVGFRSSSTTPTHKFFQWQDANGTELGSMSSSGALQATYGVQAATLTATTHSSATVFYAGGLGSASAPAFAGASVSNTGMYFTSANNIQFSANGTVRGAVVDGIGVCGGAGTSTGHPCLRSTTTPSTSDVSVQFQNDADTGLLRIGANNIGLVAGGAMVSSATATQMVVLPGSANASTFTATAGAASLAVTSMSVNSSGAANPFGLTVSSGIKVTAGYLEVDAIRFSRDGSISTRAVAGGGGGSSVTQSTFHVAGMTSTNFSASTMGPCVTGSTRTVTAVSTWIRVCYQGSSGSASTGQHTLGYLRNGAFVNGQSASIGVVQNSRFSTDISFNDSFCALDTGLTPGTQYNYCLTAANNSGTLAVPSTFGNWNPSAAARFYIESSY
jgi:hypothetical protein